MKKDESLKRDAEFAVLVEKVDTIKTDVKEIKDKLETNYVTIDRFQIVERIVYGLVTLVLLAVIGSIIRLVVIP